MHLQYSNSPDDRGAASRITKGAKVQVLKLVKEALQFPDGRPRQLAKEDIELILASLLSCTIASVRYPLLSRSYLLTVISLVEPCCG